MPRLSAPVMSRAVFALTLWAVCLSLLTPWLALPAAAQWQEGNVYDYQELPSSPPPSLPASCTPLASSSALVQQYGSQYAGLCAFQFCYQLWATPYPNQDVQQQAYAASGFFFVLPTLLNLSEVNSIVQNDNNLGSDDLAPSEYGSVFAYSVVNVTGVRSQLHFDDPASPCSPNASLSLSTNITGVALAGNDYYWYDNYLLLDFPYVSLDGIGFTIAAPYYSAWYGVVANLFAGGRTCYDVVTITAVASSDPSAWIDDITAVAMPLNTQPTSAILSETYFGAVNYAAISVTEYVEGTSTAPPSCPLYTPPSTQTVSFGYSLTQIVPTTAYDGSTMQLTSSTCVTLQVTVAGPYQRVPGLTSWVILAATGTRSFTDVHNATTTVQITGVLTNSPSTVWNNVYELNQYGPHPLSDNAVYINTSSGAVSLSKNGILFNVSTPAVGAYQTSSFPSYLVGINNEELGEPLSGWFEANGNNQYLQQSSDPSTWSAYFNVSKPPVCVAGIPTPQGPSTNYLDPSGYTTVAFGYQVQSGYSESNPGYSICVAAVLTLDLTEINSGSYYFPVIGANGTRVFTWYNGSSSTASIVGVGPQQPTWYYSQAQSVPFGYSGTGWQLQANASLLTVLGVVPSAITNLVWASGPVQSADGSPYITEQVGAETNVAELAFPPLFQTFNYSAASPFSPSAYCAQSGPLLAPGVSSSSSLPSSSQVAFSYAITPSTFVAGQEWLVCASGVLQLAGPVQLSGTQLLPPYTQSFTVVNVTGTRAFINLTSTSATVVQLTGVAPVWQASPVSVDNLVSLVYPYLSLNGLALTTSAPATYSQGQTGPALLALRAVQPIVPDGVVTVLEPQWLEANSPDYLTATGVYFSLQAVGAGATVSSVSNQDCQALVAATTSQQGLGSITVPFSYYLSATLDGNYGPWTVCVSGQLTLYAVPLYLSPSQPQVYIIRSASGTRTFYNSTGVAMSQTITGTSSTGPATNLLYGSNFFQGGLTLQLSSQAYANNWLLPSAALTNVVTVTTQLSSGVLSVTESVGDFSGTLSGTQTVNTAAAANQSAPAACPTPNQPFTSPSITLLFQFSVQSTQNSPYTGGGLAGSVCMNGSITLAAASVSNNLSQASLTSGVPLSFYPVLSVTGMRFVVDNNNQTFQFPIAGLTPVATWPQTPTNDNLLGVGGPLDSTDILQAVTDQLGLVIRFAQPVLYPLGQSSVRTQPDSLLLSWNNNQFGDPQFPSSSQQVMQLLSLSQATNASLAGLLQCPTPPIASEPIVLPTATTYYFSFNATLGSLDTECISGSFTVSSQLLPYAGNYSFLVTNATGLRAFYSTTLQTTQVSNIVGLYVSPLSDQQLLLEPPFVTVYGIGLQFDSPVGEPFSATYFAPTPVYSVILQLNPGSGQVQEYPAYAGSVMSELLVSSNASLVQQCSVGAVEAAAPSTQYAQVWYYTTDSDYNFCGSLIAEYLPVNPQSNGDISQAYQVVALTGNRSFQLTGQPWTTQLVLGLVPVNGDGNDNLLSLQCPFFDRAGLSFVGACGDCAPDGNREINLYRYFTGAHSGCDAWVDEDQWFNAYNSDDQNQINVAQWTPGTALPFSCPTGQLEGGPAYQDDGLSSNSTLSYFAYSIQGAAWDPQSTTPNLYGNWTVITQGQLTIDPAQVLIAEGEQRAGYVVVAASGTRTFISSAGVVTVQQIVNISQATPSYVYATSPPLDSVSGLVLVLDGPVLSPQGVSYSRTLRLLPVSGLPSSRLQLGLSAQQLINGPVEEVWISTANATNSPLDSVSLLPFVVSANASVLPAYVPSASAISAAVSTAVSLAASNLSLSSPSTQLYWQYLLSSDGAVQSYSSLWQVCASGQLTLATSANSAVLVQGLMRYPVTSISGQRVLVQYQTVYSELLQAYAGASLTVNATISNQTVSGLGAAGQQGADNLLAVSTLPSGVLLAFLTEGGGLGLALSSPAVYASGTSSYSQVTLTASQQDPSLPAFYSPALASQEAWSNGSFSQGGLWLQRSPFPACSLQAQPAPGSSGSVPAVAVQLPAAQSWLLVYVLNWTAVVPDPSAPVSACTVAVLSVAGLTVQTGFGSAQGVLAGAGRRWETFLDGSQAEDVVNGTSGLLYTGSLNSRLLDTVGLSITSSVGLQWVVYYSLQTAAYQEQNRPASIQQSLQLTQLSAGQTPTISQALCRQQVPPAAISSSTGSVSSSASPSSPAASQSSSSVSTSASPSSTGSVSPSSSPSSPVQSSSSVSPSVSTTSSVSSSALSQSSASAPSVSPLVSSASSVSSGLSAPSVSSSPSAAQPAGSTSATSLAAPFLLSSSIVASSAAAVPVPSSSSSSSGPAPSTSSSSSSSGLSHGAIAGIVIGSVVGALLIVFICLLAAVLARGRGSDKSRATSARSSEVSDVRPASTAVSQVEASQVGQEVELGRI